VPHVRSRICVRVEKGLGPSPAVVLAVFCQPATGCTTVSPVAAMVVDQVYFLMFDMGVSENREPKKSHFY